MILFGKENIMSFTDEEIELMSEINIMHLDLTKKELEVAEHIGLDICGNSSGLYNLVMIRQGLLFENKYQKEIDAGIYDYALASTVEESPAYLGNVGEILESVNDVTVYICK